MCWVTKAFYHSLQVTETYYLEVERMQQQVVQALDALDPASVPGLLFLAANIRHYCSQVSTLTSAFVNGSELMRPEQRALLLLLQVTPQLRQQLLECSALQSRQEHSGDCVAEKLCKAPGVGAALPGTTCHR
jgi:hypothetical protein